MLKIIESIIIKTHFTVLGILAVVCVFLTLLHEQLSVVVFTMIESTTQPYHYV